MITIPQNEKKNEVQKILSPMKMMAKNISLRKTSYFVRIDGSIFIWLLGKKSLLRVGVS